ncbi:hypothetical protein NDU88_001758 [Pleurodeles waltl]|uniref:Uncharacterized protein n=1 Tax=Pleurodeles waltl TaxID=8319 RepID=A0AAV7TIP2_PLEWA|nr:hypothetical protein NDU88_001758 [Pleurodeles waltl]
MLQPGPPRLARPRGRGHPATTTRLGAPHLGPISPHAGGPRRPPRDPTQYLPTTRPAPAGHESLLRPPTWKGCSSGRRAGPYYRPASGSARRATHHRGSSPKRSTAADKVTTGI